MLLKEKGKCQTQRRELSSGNLQCSLLSRDCVTYMHFGSTAAQQIYKSWIKWHNCIAHMHDLFFFLLLLRAAERMDMGRCKVTWQALPCVRLSCLVWKRELCSTFPWNLSDLHKLILFYSLSSKDLNVRPPQFLMIPRNPWTLRHQVQMLPTIHFLFLLAYIQSHIGQGVGRAKSMSCCANK